jgi:predicted RNA-binding Zn ribbon-like protein
VVTGQLLSSSDGTEWWFDSGAVSLDFSYASADSAPALSRWLSARFDRLDDGTSERDLVDAEGLRQAIARLALAATGTAELQPDDVDTVNLFAAMPDIPPALDGGRRQAGRNAVRTSQALSTIARDAVQLLSFNSEERIRACDADDCSLIFYDESRTNNRRWCSMQRCGNRAKGRALRARSA